MVFKKTSTTNINLTLTIDRVVIDRVDYFNSFSLSDRRAAPHSRVQQYRLMAVSAVIQSAARSERGRTLNNVTYAGGREGGREGRGGEGGEGRGGEGRGEGRGGEGGEGRGGEGRAGEGRAGQGRAGQGRAGEGRGGEGRGLSTPSTNQNLCDRGA